MSDNKGVLVYCETTNNILSKIATEALGAGAALAKDLGQTLSAIILGSDISTAPGEAIAFGAEKVYVLDDPLLKDYLTDAYLMAMEKIIRQTSPSVVLLGQTSIGRDLTPRLAFRFETAATLDCIALSVDPETKRILQTKPVYGGNALAVYVCQTDPQFATIRSKAMAPLERDPSRKGEIIKVAAGIDPAKIRTRIIERKTETASGIKLEDARVVVTGGRGIGGQDGFKQLEELTGAKRRPGGSRPACDNKWISDTLQVGLTGKIVSPDLYIAVAVSGSSQHLSGCSGSRVIVAINKDPEANIFKVAHYGIVADWKKAIPAFTTKIKELTG